MARHVAIVGAGPAGLSAALEAHHRGARVTVIDEASLPGGQIYRQSAVSDAQGVGLKRELRRKKNLLDAFAAVAADIDYRADHTAYALFEGPELHISTGDRSEVLRPDNVILATGVSERAIPFPGWTLPGVMSVGAVQTLLKSQGVRVGERVVVAGAGVLPLALAAQLVQSGGRVVCVALLHPVSSIGWYPYAVWTGLAVIWEGLQYLSILRHAGVKVLSHHVPKRVDGSDHLESVQLVRHDGTGQPVLGTEHRISCDALAVNYGFTVNSELASMSGARVTYLPEQGGWTPVTDRYCRSSVPGVLVAGDGARLRGAWAAIAEGRIAGAVACSDDNDEALAKLRMELKPAFSDRRRHESFQNALRRLLRLPPGVWRWAEADTIVCRCECVSRAELVRAVADGHMSLNAIKKNTRAGMGWCGGRMCMQNVAAICAGGRLAANLPPMTPRPVARPVSLQSLRDQDSGSG